MTSSSKVESVLSLILFLSFVFDPSILKEGYIPRYRTEFCILMFLIIFRLEWQSKQAASVYDTANAES